MLQKPQVIIHNRILQELTETVEQNPEIHVPRADKIQEWTLHCILEQLQGINRGINAIAHELRHPEN